MWVGINLYWVELEIQETSWMINTTTSKISIFMSISLLEIKLSKRNYKLKYWVKVDCRIRVGVWSSDRIILSNLEAYSFSWIQIKVFFDLDYGQICIQLTRHLTLSYIKGLILGYMYVIHMLIHTNVSNSGVLSILDLGLFD